MCGIFGIYQLDNRPIAVSVLERATATLHHRGPDDEGYLLAQTGTGQVVACRGASTAAGLALPALNSFSGAQHDLAFGFRRLSILDVSMAGHQPMASADGRCWLIFNGEIYNYIELREVLRQFGHTFKTGADSEVLLAGFAQWGKAVLDRVVGMFAFAVLDTRARRLFLARDFFGIKPLYYTMQAGAFAFASEIKALLELPNVARVVDAAALYPYLRDGITDQDERTLFAGIYQLPPAHYLELDLTHFQTPAPQRYWQLKIDRPLDLSLEEAAEHTCDLFLENVRLHLRSDVPVGAALSGGIDSSSIVMGMRRVQGDKLDIHTFSYIADEPGVSEERWVDLVGVAAHTSVHKTRPGPSELVTDLEHLIAVQDEPFGSTSIYAQHRVFQLAHEAGIKVMEDGQGADEMLGGYQGFVLSRLLSLARQLRFAEARRFMSASRDLMDHQGALLAGRVLRPVLPPPLRDLGLKMVKRDAGWLNTPWFAERGVAPQRSYQYSAREQLRKDLYNAFSRSSLPMLLRYEDRNSMAFSIESRVPFLTPALVQFVFSLPEDYIISSAGLTKAVFRRAMRGMVPDAVLDRRDKIGFETPEQRWLTLLRPWVDGILNGNTMHGIGALKADKIIEEWRLIQSGAKPFNFRLWRWINLARWAEVYKVRF